mmetsp:Transcript_30202/g.44649  ORF Transcript_30202/g.44649 Transcript_30202/m.44649 type:complete len:121 (-) Transcript_30202:1178-1540(-)
MSHSNNNNNSNDYYDDDYDEEMSYDNFSDEVFSDLEDQGDDDDLPHAEYKAKGNEAYQKKDYRQAISLYSSAIETAICDNEEEEEADDGDSCCCCSEKETKRKKSDESPPPSRRQSSSQQ